MKEDTSENVEFAIKLKEDVLVLVDSHFPVDKFMGTSWKYGKLCMVIDQYEIIWIRYWESTIYKW